MIWSRDITFRFQNSPFYVKSFHKEKDIVRYSDRKKINQNDHVNILDYIKEEPAMIDLEKYFPSELLTKRSFSSLESSELNKFTIFTYHKIIFQIIIFYLFYPFLRMNTNKNNLNDGINLKRLEQQESASSENRVKEPEKDDAVKLFFFKLLFFSFIYFVLYIVGCRYS